MSWTRTDYRLLFVLSVAAVFATSAVSGSSRADDRQAPPPTRAVLPNLGTYDPTGPHVAARTAITDASKVYAVPQVAKPGCRAIIDDPTFGSDLERIAENTGASTTPVTGTWSSDARHSYSKQQPWNSDGTLIAIENRNGASPPYLLLDGNSYVPKQALCSSLYDYRWHPGKAHPQEMINVNGAGTELAWYDVTNCSKTRSWTLPLAAGYGIGSSEGNPSADGRFIAVGNQSQVVVVDMDPQPPYAPYPNKRIGPVYTFPACSLDVSNPTSTCGLDWLSISPSGKYVVVQYDGSSTLGYGQMRVFDIDTTTLAVTGPHRMAQSSPRCPDRPNGWILSWNHADMTLDGASGDVVVGGPECGATTGHPTKVRLSDGATTALTSKRNEASVFHASCRNLDRPGWAYFSFWKSDGLRFSDEIVAIKLDGSRSVERLAHTHTAPTGCYRCEAHPVPSRDGGRVIFASNWAQDCGSGCGSASEIKDYVVTDQQSGDVTRPALIQDLRQEK